MNITHAVDEKIEGDKLSAIFNRQKSLMEKYHDIEKRSGLLQTEDCPVNLDDKRGQARIKDFSWRVTEELGEALDAKRSGDWEHFAEELIDGLHFLTELTVLAGKDAEDLILDIDEKTDRLDFLCNFVNVEGNTLSELVTSFIENIGMMCNCLKNKPWKQSNMITDKNAFYSKLLAVWTSYVAIMVKAGLDSEMIANVYLKKSQVNQFRQRTNY